MSMKVIMKVILSWENAYVLLNTSGIKMEK